MAAEVSKQTLSEEDISGSVHELQVETEEDMLLFVCHMAECIALQRDIELTTVSIEYLRERVIHNILNFVTTV